MPPGLGLWSEFVNILHSPLYPVKLSRGAQTFEQGGGMETRLDEYMTAQEVADHYRLPLQTIYGVRDKGENALRLRRGSRTSDQA